MAEKQDIAMNQFPVVTSMKYVYGEKTDSGQAKMELPSLSALLSIKGIGITSLNDLNYTYKVLNEGLSVVYNRKDRKFTDRIWCLYSCAAFI